VAIIAILAGIVIVALNPGKQLGDSRNAQRKSDVNTILSAVYQYSIDNNGNLPATILPGTCGTTDTTTGNTTAICKQGIDPAVCLTAHMIDLSAISAGQKYLTAVPIDPSISASDTGNGNGYFIAKSANGRVTVCGHSEPNGPSDLISVTK